MSHQGYRYLLTCISSGIICHIIFNRFEPHHILAHLVLLVAFPLLLAAFCYTQWNSNILLTIGLYMGTLVISVIAYRLSPFHPLASFPGQTVARVSRIWSSVISRRGYQHIYYHELVLKYGPVIRIGPNHIITTEASAIPVVLGAGPFRKSDRYVTFVTPKEPGSLLAVVDPHEHAERRRLWEKGMNFKALQSYKEIIHSRLQQLISLLSQQPEGVDINLSTWFSLFSQMRRFDIMGDLAFSGQFDALQGGSTSTELLDHLQGIRTALGIQDYLMLLTWFRYYIPFIPQRLMTEVSWFRQFSTNAMIRRMKNGPKSQDFFYHLLNEEQEEDGGDGLPLPIGTLFREASLIIPAGYDTTANAGCHAFFYLLTHPIYLKRLQDEVDQHFSNVDEVYSKDDLQNLPYLNAVINETLRLAPGLASGSQRYLPKGNGNNGGIMLGNTWIPEGTHVQIHTYSIHRNPKYFSPEPESFRPERWLEKGYTTDKSAFIPFSYGPANCIGKQIALLKLRKTLCALVKSFDLELSPEFDLDKWNRDVKEQFILGRGDLPARVRRRS